VKPTPKAVNTPWHHFIVHGLGKPGSSATVSNNIVEYRDMCPTLALRMSAIV